MKEYIDKAVVKAELERKKIPFKKDIDDGVYPTYLCALMDFEDFIKTLEVKDMDLNLNSFDATVCKIGSTYLKEMDRDAIVKALEPYKDGDKVKVIIKAQK